MTRHGCLARLVEDKTVDYRFAGPHHSLGDAVFRGALRQQIPPIRAIWNAGTHCMLGRLRFSPTAQYRWLGFDFSSFDEKGMRASNGPTTVEFRLPGDTL